MILSEYIRPDKSIGIIGGGARGLLLALKAKAMGFTVNVLDPISNCPASRVCDRLFTAEYDNQLEIERLARISDVITYTTSKLDIDVLSRLESKINLPQGIELLALAQDKLMERGFLEDNGINVSPYATIVQITDIEENVDGIGYPCRLRQTRGNQEMLINGPADIFDALNMVKSSTCILESIIPESKTYGLSIARNDRGEITFFPIIDVNYDYNQLKDLSTIVYLEEELQEEMCRIATVIANSIEFNGILTIEFDVTSYGAIYVKGIIPFVDEHIYYSMEACEIDGFEAHIRGLCNWPLLSHSRLFSDAITTLVPGRDLSLAKRQVPQQAHWHFHFYDRDDAFADTIVGHITILTDDVEAAREEVEKAMM